MFGAIAGGIASALAGGAMSKLFGGGQKAASGGIQGDVLATDNNTVGMGDAGIKSAIQGSNVPNPDEAVPSFVSGAMAKAGKGLLEGTLQAGTSAVSDKLLDLVGLGGKSAADKGKDTRDYLAAAFPELNDVEPAGAGPGHRAVFLFPPDEGHFACPAGAGGAYAGAHQPEPQPRRSEPGQGALPGLFHEPVRHLYQQTGTFPRPTLQDLQYARAGPPSARTALPLLHRTGIQGLLQRVRHRFPLDLPRLHRTGQRAAA